MAQHSDLRLQCAFVVALVMVLASSAVSARIAVHLRGMDNEERTGGDPLATRMPADVVGSDGVGSKAIAGRTQQARKLKVAGPGSSPRPHRASRSPRPSPSTYPPPSPPPLPTPPPPRLPSPSPPSPRPPVPLAGGGTPLGGSQCSDAQATMDQANVYRTWHQAPAVQWSSSLAADAQAYAEVLATKQCAIIHAGVGGEMLYSRGGYPAPDLSCKGAIDGWYGEEVNYNFTVSNAFDYNWPRNIGHFSQLVWRGSSAIGCGVAKVDPPKRYTPEAFGGCKIIVCRMKAPGNLAANSYFRTNVLPLVQ
ncbi:Protein PRY2 [Tetrabaena socialis]|uniref:Protein PRY2 n=1 Tax=Tetrabaena socialis TaxID=47790 RepID=A0A2J8AEP0_9CHLO|nr:Protein PRY2 [Tetrabaena socialis]|eukprot:PNH10966.1 Protein PRY2 [Tetrabaena socialis]